jgi:hypothetical protein
MLRDDFTQFLVEKDDALYFMEIKHSKFNTHSLLSLNLNVDASHFDIINRIEGNIQTDESIDCMNPSYDELSIDIFVSSKSWFASSFF